MKDTTFADILAGKTEGSFVYRDELVFAIMDLFPVNPGHTLVIPNRLVANVAELTEEESNRLFSVGRSIAEAIRASDIPSEGINYFIADGEAAGQEVFHVHLHILPRVAGDGFGFRRVSDPSKPANRKQLDNEAESLSDIL